MVVVVVVVVVVVTTVVVLFFLVVGFVWKCKGRQQKSLAGKVKDTGGSLNVDETWESDVDPISGDMYYYTKEGEGRSTWTNPQEKNNKEVEMVNHPRKVSSDPILSTVCTPKV